jgi:hypothetical protein
VNLYLAGIYASNLNLRGRMFARLNAKEQEDRKAAQYILESYHYIHKQKYVEQLREDNTKVFLDSGAFSAYSKGITVDLPTYCDYIKRNHDVIERSDGVLLASVLDGIGDPLLTYQNQCAMESLGVTPLPCFHYGEDERYLEYYISRYPYITLGGMVPIANDQLYYWLDRLWEKYLCDGSGRARLKVHGFGLTAFELIKRYPWFSVDSSTWVQAAAMGGVHLPGIGIVTVSSTSPARKKQGAHYNTLPPPQQERIKEIIEAAGYDLERLKTTYESRWAFNIWAFPTRSKLFPSVERFIPDRKELF